MAQSSEFMLDDISPPRLTAPQAFNLARGVVADWAREDAHYNRGTTWTTETYEAEVRRYALIHMSPEDRSKFEEQHGECL